jgi:hypothetical protein
VTRPWFILTCLLMAVSFCLGGNFLTAWRANQPKPVFAEVEGDEEEEEGAR